MKYAMKEQEYRQFRLVVEYFPREEASALWYWEVRESGELLDAGHASDAEIAMVDAHQTIEKHIDY